MIYNNSRYENWVFLTNHAEADVLTIRLGSYRWYELTADETWLRSLRTSARVLLRMIRRLSRVKDAV